MVKETLILLKFICCQSLNVDDWLDKLCEEIRSACLI